jgi:acyl-CoA thioester hydrolase
MEYSSNLIKVRYCETDQMGFVHHSNYLKYFELARIEWLENLGIFYQEIENQGILMPILRAELIFKKPLFFGTSFKIKVILKQPPMAKIEFQYQIINEMNEITCNGSTVLAFISSTNKKPIRCPEIFKKIFKDSSN